MKLITLLENDDPKAFADKAIKALKNISAGETTDQEYEMLHDDAMRKSKAGWNLSDVINYMSNSEMINPNIPEDKAIANMKKISDKYK